MRKTGISWFAAGLLALSLATSAGAIAHQTGCPGIAVDRTTNAIWTTDTVRDESTGAEVDVRLTVSGIGAGTVVEVAAGGLWLPVAPAGGTFDASAARFTPGGVVQFQLATDDGCDDEWSGDY